MAAVRKDIRPEEHVLSYLLHLTNTIIAVCKDIHYCFSIFPCVRNKTQPFAVRKDIRPFETFTFGYPTLNKHNHCSPQRHTILLLDFLLSSWPQSAKTYDLKKHVLSYLLHLTNTIIAVRSPTLNKHNHCSLQRHTILLLDFPLCS